MQRNDGGPAFPGGELLFDDCKTPYQIGMSLRDWFAGQAISGAVANEDYANQPKIYARAAYKLADAMLAAREARSDEA